METASLNEIRKAFGSLSPKEMAELCLRLGRYKKENKELITYILYYECDPSGFLRAVKNETNTQIAAINRSNNYYILKGIRKIIRMLDKYSHFAAKKEIEAEMHIYLWKSLRENGIWIPSQGTLRNLFERQFLKIKKSISELHEDLQFDYGEELKELRKLTN
ncbi:MAG: hypothetical protein IPH88_17195 [Bacteroidales bacterium]|nr:hypothetical protein [Bacteroidales bacterium]